MVGRKKENGAAKSIFAHAEMLGIRTKTTFGAISTPSRADRFDHPPAAAVAIVDVVCKRYLPGWKTGLCLFTCVGYSDSNALLYSPIHARTRSGASCCLRRLEHISLICAQVPVLVVVVHV